MSRTAVIWFRRDLRVHDHPALSAAAREYERVVPVFVLDDRLLHGRFASGARTAFMLGCLASLDAALRERGAALCVRRGAPERALVQLARDTGAEAVLWTSDVAPFARARDMRVTEALREAGLQARPYGGAYTVDVSRVRRPDGAAFTVFSPFDRALRATPRRAVLDPPGALAPHDGVDAGRVPALGELGLHAKLTAAAREPGEPAARRAMEAWLRGPIEGYGRRHALAEGTTSVLSPYLRWGCLSALELEQRAAALDLRAARSFVRQLHWRDFHAHVLLLHPWSARHEFQAGLRELDYADDPERLAAWHEGRTGFPLVDAGMRQLAATGWMHNRARLTAGSFLTKDLHLDWRAGEAWFERLLLDGEPAQNNGNWQWIASTGVDPQPVFKRVLNPVLQQQRFDPAGTFVRRWVPELQHVPEERLAKPWTMSRAEQRAAGCGIGDGGDYPAPIVDHAAERLRALERYAAATAAR